MKTESDHFSDWESHVFGYGYGSGEEFTIPALRSFFSLVGIPVRPGAGSARSYDYSVLELRLGGAVAWLLINALCHAEIIEYGTSTRYGWLTERGEQLRKFILAHSDEELIELTEHNQDYNECYPDHCNCDDGPCSNPFWVNRKKTA